MNELALALAMTLAANVEYEILMPNADDPVVYDVSLLQQAAPADSLAPCSYLIVSSPRSDDSSKSSGEAFSAYFDGNFFRFRGSRMTEWHLPADSLQFKTGIQRAEMFASLLPAFVAENLGAIASDSAYKYSSERLPDGGVSIKGSESRRGYLLREFSYRLDPSGRPVYSEITANPGEMSEQVVTARYTYVENPDTVPLSEDRLEALFPEVFAKFRQSNFSLASLVGEPMPTFSVPTISGERLTHHRGESFDSPTVIVVTDATDVSPRIDAAPGESVIYAFTGNDSAAISDLMGTPAPDETVAYSARSLARDCGIKAFPAIIRCTADGTIEKVDLSSEQSIP